MKILIYGANGFTGRLIVERSLEEDLDIVLGGRSSKIEELADHYELPSRTFPLINKANIEANLQDIDAVLHCAGPFTLTGKPMIHACIVTGTHYLDITGELEIFELCEDLFAEAEQAGVLLLPGCGFDIIPTDNLGTMLHEKYPEGDRLEIAIYGMGRPSKGTSRSIVKILADGSKIRRNGELQSISHGTVTGEFEFMNGKRRSCTAVPLPDLISTYHGTGIPNITMYYTMKPAMITMTKIFRPLFWFLKFPPFASIARSISGFFASNPDDEFREESPSFIRARLEGVDKTMVADLKTPNAYDLTADLTVRALVYLDSLDSIPIGFHSPSQVLGSDFITTCDDVELQFPSPE